MIQSLLYNPFTYVHCVHRRRRRQLITCNALPIVLEVFAFMTSLFVIEFGPNRESWSVWSVWRNHLAVDDFWSRTMRPKRSDSDGDRLKDLGASSLSSALTSARPFWIRRDDGFSLRFRGSEQQRWWGRRENFDKILEKDGYSKHQTHILITYLDAEYKEIGRG